MSRIAKKFILVPKCIKVNINKNKIILYKDNLCVSNKFHISVLPLFKNNKIIFNTNKNYIKSWMYAGTARAIINNAIFGLINNFKKVLILVGIGYKANIENNILYLNLGFSYTIKYNIPFNIKLKCLDNNKIIVEGYDKQLVGQIASDIRFFRPPECYKNGKGIRYENEIVIIKEHKKKLNK